MWWFNLALGLQFGWEVLASNRSCMLEATFGQDPWDFWSNQKSPLVLLGRVGRGSSFCPRSSWTLPMRDCSYQDCFGRARLGTITCLFFPEKLWLLVLLAAATRVQGGVEGGGQAGGLFHLTSKHSCTRASSSWCSITRISIILDLIFPVNSEGKAPSRSGSALGRFEPLLKMPTPARGGSWGSGSRQAGWVTASLAPSHDSPSQIGTLQDPRPEQLPLSPRMQLHGPGGGDPRRASWGGRHRQGPLLPGWLLQAGEERLMFG